MKMSMVPARRSTWPFIVPFRGGTPSGAALAIGIVAAERAGDSEFPSAAQTAGTQDGAAPDAGCIGLGNQPLPR